MQNQIAGDSLTPGCPIAGNSLTPGCQDSGETIPPESPATGETTSPASNFEKKQGCLDIEHYLWLPAVKILSAVFQKHNHEIRVVGGAVRDIILHNKPKDIDLCTTANPEEMLEILKEAGLHYRETGIQHGTVTIYKKGHQFEMTSLRMDTIVDGRKVCLYGRSFKEDATRRDLTMNAMSLDVNGRLYDYFSGQENLCEGKLRFVEDATTRVTEDPIRILRYFRFLSSGLFGVEECPAEYKVLFMEKRSCLADPSIVAGERIWREIGRVLASDKCCETLEAMKECMILRSLGFPVLDDSSMSDLINSSYTVLELDTEGRAAAVLGLLFKGKQDLLTDLCNRWKVSNRVREVATLAADYTSNFPTLKDIKQKLYQDMHPTRFYEQKMVLLQIVGCDKTSLLSKEHLEELEQFERPVFPFTKDHFARVPQFRAKQKEAADELRKEWVKSGFILGVPEMIVMLRDMVAQ